MARAPRRRFAPDRGRWDAANLDDRPVLHCGYPRQAAPPSGFADGPGREDCVERDDPMTTAIAGSPAFDAVIAQFQEVRSEQIATILARRNPGVLAWGVRFGDLDK